MAQVWVEITEWHIEHGVRRDCFNCPGALAISEHLLPGYGVEVSSQEVRFGPLTAPEWFPRWDDESQLAEQVLFQYLDPTAIQTSRPSPSVLQKFVFNFDEDDGGWWEDALPTGFYIDIPNNMHIGGGE